MSAPSKSRVWSEARRQQDAELPTLIRRRPRRALPRRSWWQRLLAWLDGQTVAYPYRCAVCEHRSADVEAHCRHLAEHRGGAR